MIGLWPFLPAREAKCSPHHSFLAQVLCVCVCVYMCTCMCICPHAQLCVLLCMHVWREERPAAAVILSHHLLLRQGLLLSWNSSRLHWQANKAQEDPGIHPPPPSSTGIVSVHRHACLAGGKCALPCVPGFSIRVLAWNAGPLACTASTCPAETLLAF